MIVREKNGLVHGERYEKEYNNLNASPTVIEKQKDN